MIEINELDNTIKMTRGDTLITTISLTIGDEPYVPVEGDTIRFYVKTPRMTAGNKQYKDVDPLIEKVIPMDTLQLRLDPEDTKSLNFGDYVYDLEMTYSTGLVDTFINNAKLRLVPEVD